MTQIIALIGLRGSKNWMPERTTPAEYRNYIKQAREIYRKTDNQEIRKIFGQFVDSCPGCGADIENCRPKGLSAGRHFNIVTYKCGRCGRIFKRVEEVGGREDQQSD